MRYAIVLTLLLAQQPTVPVSFTGNVPLVAGPAGARGPTGATGASATPPLLPSVLGAGVFMLIRGRNAAGAISAQQWARIDGLGITGPDGAHIITGIGSGTDSSLPPMPTAPGSYAPVVAITQPTPGGPSLRNVDWASIQTPLLLQQGPTGYTLSAVPNGTTVSIGQPVAVTQFTAADPDGGYTLPSNGPTIGAVQLVFAGAAFQQPNTYQVLGNRVLPNPGPWSGAVSIVWNGQ